MIDPNSVTPHPQNPRRGDVDAIAESIGENGYFAPISVQRSSGHVIIGNHRLLAARMVGMAAIPAIWLDVDDALALRILIADNRYAELATWHDESLLGLLDGMASVDELLGSGYDDDSLALLRDLIAGPVAEPDGPGPGLPSAEVECKVGTIHFSVSRDRWDAFEAEITAEAGTRHEQAVTAVIERLGI